MSAYFFKIFDNMDNSDVYSVLGGFPPISLKEMGEVRLMNRIDTKFVTARRNLPTLLDLMADNYYVQEIDGKRVCSYKTLYLDTDRCDFYMEHHNGKLTRQKVRIREYVESHLSFLEVKNKNNRGRTKKKRIVLEDSDIHSANASDFLRQYLPFAPDELSAHLANQFQRITLVNRQKTERLTIDINLGFHNMRTNEDYALNQIAIIELKQDGNAYSPVREYLQKLRIFPMGFSKYCIGCAFTNHLLKQNRFKKKLHKIHKLTGQPQAAVSC